MSYETKFSGFIAMCRDAKADGAEGVLIDHPQVLGDNYAEIVESLSRLADAGLHLVINRRLGPPATAH